ncbi:MAG: heavy metal translocating P-type ATPase [Desulfuromonadales bacterium]
MPFSAATPGAVCAHCGLPLPPGAPICAGEGAERTFFCCVGCRGAWHILREAGLGGYYINRTLTQTGLPEGAFREEFNAAHLQHFVTPEPDGSARLLFHIEGIRCASCIWVIETLLARLDGVLEARLNYGTQRAAIRFAPDRSDPAQIFAAVVRLGYRPRPLGADLAQRRAQQERHSLLIRFGTAFFFSMQLMGYSLALYAGYFSGIDAQTKALLHGFAAVAATPVVFYGGAPFLRGAWRSLRNGRPDMELLIALGVLAAYGVSLHALLVGGEIYFDTAAMIVTLILAGRLLESGARQRAGAGVDRLLRLAPETAQRVTADGSEEVASAQLAVDDRIRVRPGERFAVDGEIIEGEGQIDEAAVTGEAFPVRRRPGEMIRAGTVNLDGVLLVRVAATAAESFVARVARLVEEAQMRRAPVQRLADRVAAFFVPAVALLAAGAWLYWRLVPDPLVQPWLAAVAVLVVACPCALGLATPTAILVASGAAAGRGILFRGGDILEATGRLTTAAFDKTGTLTEGRPEIVAVQPAVGVSAAELLGKAAGAEIGSLHPLAQAIVAEAQGRRLPIETAGKRTAQAGLGVLYQREEDGEAVYIGSREFLRRNGLPVPATPSAGTEVHVTQGTRYLGCLLLEDRPRPQAGACLEALRRSGVRTVLLTGDTEVAAERLLRQVRLAEAHANLDPAGKALWIAEARRAGETVLMVGDGINDAPALAEADVGCSLAGSTDIALENADLILTRPDLTLLAEATALARRTLTIIRQNLFWAFFYNLLALPLAASGRLAPIHAAAAMALSSICVVGNSLRLARCPVTRIGEEKPTSNQKPQS